MEQINHRLIQSKVFLENPLKDLLQSQYNQWKDHEVRIITSENYNTFFDYRTGYFVRCGKTIEEDPSYAKLGPEILDMEISTICHGITDVGPCKFCYKANTGKGTNMPFETFRKIFDKMPPNLTQIAFGIGDIDAHPDLEHFLNYCTANPQGKKVIPNITINGDRLTSDYVQILADNCGAVAVSHYDDDVCFNAVKMLTDAGMTQINIHQMISEETYEEAKNLLVSTQTDPRLKKLNAVVFLSLKTKGRGKDFHPLNQNLFTSLIDYAMNNDIRIGFDSCSTLKFFTAVQHHPKFSDFQTLAEPCESTLFSSYINVDGMFFPCSFSEGSLKKWGKSEGLDVINADTFITDIWEHKKTQSFRQTLLNTAKCNKFLCRTCPLYDV